MVRYVDGVREELDAPTEFFFDAAENKLYLFPNGTVDSIDTSNLVVPVLKRLIEIKGTQAAPATNVALHGLSFRYDKRSLTEADRRRDAAYTYMDEWGAPSGLVP